MAKSNKLQEIPAPVLVAVAVFAMILVVWQAMRTFGPDPEVQKGMEDNRFITQMAIKSGGDISRLSEAEREKLQKMTKGDGELVLRMHPSAAMGRARAGK
jgi:hypothetical protein